MFETFDSCAWHFVCCYFINNFKVFILIINMTGWPKILLSQTWYIRAGRVLVTPPPPSSPWDQGCSLVTDYTSCQLKLATFLPSQLSSSSSLEVSCVLLLVYCHTFPHILMLSNANLLSDAEFPCVHFLQCLSSERCLLAITVIWVNLSVSTVTWAGHTAVHWPMCSSSLIHDRLLRWYLTNEPSWSDDYSWCTPVSYRWLSHVLPRVSYVPLQQVPLL